MIPNEVLLEHIAGLRSEVGALSTLAEQVLIELRRVTLSLDELTQASERHTRAATEAAATHVKITSDHARLVERVRALEEAAL